MVSQEQSLEVEVGSIFSYTWGYDQTNVEYFQVVSRTKSGVYLSPIKSGTVADSEGFMSDSVVPLKDEFIAKCGHPSPYGTPCGGYKSWSQHFESCGAFDHAFVPVVEKFFKKLRLVNGKPYLSFDHGCGSLVLPGQTEYRSWYA